MRFIFADLFQTIRSRVDLVLNILKLGNDKYANKD